MSRMRVRSGGLAVAGVAGLAMAVLIASPAMADTSQSRASALQMTLAGGTVASSGQTTASNDGTTETNTGDPTPPLAVLGAQTVLTAGVLGQPSRAYTTGSSSACAGVLAPGGTLGIDNFGFCEASAGGTAVFNLGTIGGAAITLVVVIAYAECQADTVNGISNVSGDSRFIEVTLESSLTGVLLEVEESLPNTTVPIPGIGSLIINRQQSAGPGQLTVTALSFTEEASGLAEFELGSVSCGPNAVAPPVPAIPAAGMPVAAGLVAIVATGGFLWRRRRSLARL